MLIRITALLGILAASISPAAAADPTGSVNPCAALVICVGATDPGGTPAPGSTSPGGSGGSGGVQMCSWNGQQWPCWDDILGWFNTSDGCYYHLSEPQPPANDPEWGGHQPSEGAVYEVNCRGVGGQLTAKPSTFRAQGPGGAPPDRPIDLANQALAQIHLEPPQLHASPAANAVVGVPVWLWYTPTARSFDPQTATAKGVRISVTATVTFDSIDWDTDDGAIVTCRGAGTAYAPGATTTCSHTYTASSAAKHGANNKYWLTGTVWWRVRAVINPGGALVTPEFRYPVPSAIDQPLALSVGEVQVLN